MTTYRIDHSIYHDDDIGFADAVAQAYAKHIRPQCLCSGIGTEMYIAKIGGKYFVKRMPDTGGQHLSSCESYEPPPELSGLGQVLGTAIDERVDDGYTALRLGFALSKGGKRPPSATNNESDSVKTDGNKLTLRGMLHYLWEQAGFHKWSPAMDGKRSWYTIRKYLLRAAQDKRAKGLELAELLYVPESFSIQHKVEITERRAAQFARIASGQSTGRQLMLMIAEVKEITTSRFGYKIIVKHVPDTSFMLNEDLHKRLQKRFSTELALWDADPDLHLMMIATFGVGAAGVTNLEELALITVTQNWIPIESMYDKSLVDKLTHDKRRFVKGLRYNLASNRPLASAVLSDTEYPVALYVVPPGAAESYTIATHELIAQSQLMPWIWTATDEHMPALPAPMATQRPMSSAAGAAEPQLSAAAGHP